MKFSAHHTSFPVKDIEVSKSFYGGFLGLEEIERPERFTFPGAWYRAGPIEVHLIQAPEGLDLGSAPPAISPFARHAALAIEDYDKALAYCREAGLEVFESSPEIGQLWISDPDGHVLELIVPAG